MSDALFPIVGSPDLERGLRFYRDLLGAEEEYRFPEEGDPVYVGLTLGGAHLGVSQDDDAPAGAGRMAIWVYVEDCDATVEVLRAAGAEVTEEPVDQPWGERVARLRDFDGNDVIIGQRAG